MKYYTVDRRDSLQKGQLIELVKYNDVKPAEFQQHVDFLFPNGVSNHGEQYILKGNTPANGVNSLLELLFEYVRRSEFPNCPSRFQSLFGLGTIAEAKTFRARHGNGSGTIWLVECNDVMKGDMSLLHLNGTLLCLSLNASRYWSGQTSNTPFWEYLLKLPIRIVEKVS